MLIRIRLEVDNLNYGMKGVDASNNETIGVTFARQVSIDRELCRWHR
jgi:hypothetical protein